MPLYHKRRGIGERKKKKGHPYHSLAAHELPSNPVSFCLDTFFEVFVSFLFAISENRGPISSPFSTFSAPASLQIP